MSNKWLWAIVLFCSPLFHFAQTTFPVNGANDPQVTRYAIINAYIQVSPDVEPFQGTLEIENGKIKAVKKQREAYDTTAIAVDMQGKYIYPSFIDIYSDYGLPKFSEKKKRGRNRSQAPQYESETKGAFGWNEAIKPETNAAFLFARNEKEAEELRQMGFGTVATFVQDGIARGTSLVVTLSSKAENKSIISEQASANFSFNKGSSKQVYPTSLMGSMALVRQTFYDAQAYKNSVLEETNLSLEAFNKQQQLPLVFEAASKWDIPRIQSIGKEFSKNFIIKTAGDEYQIANELVKTGARFIVPVNFPAPLNVKTVFDENQVNYTDLHHRSQAGFNPFVLQQKNIPFAFTSDGLKNKKEFLESVKYAIKHRLDEKTALAALTTVPAAFLNISDKVGTLEKGKLANFIISDDEIFGKGAKVLENWVQGERHIINYGKDYKLSGEFDVYVEGKKVSAIKVYFEKDKLKVITDNSSQVVSEVEYSEEKQQFNFTIKSMEYNRSFTGWSVDWGRHEGIGSDENGKIFSWYAIDTDLTDTAVMLTRPNVKIMRAYPHFPYAYAEKDSNTFLVRGATVWTNENEGVLQQADVLVVKGKIQKVGVVKPEDTFFYGVSKVIDGKGKHLTTGIIDEHSHIAIMGGVNESSESSTAEVRIGDVINPEDINIYRQLAGGVTTSQLLHGSANVIGGQSAVIKLKWGEMPEDMKFKGASGRIKFALGENVKQSNWGEKFTERFPQTRMGVEQVFENFFTLAKEYEKTWDDYKKGKTKKQPRKNLELEALLEVIKGERLVSCHSYSQQEINMLMKVAEKYGFTINIFTHVLEGYKIADKLKEHGAGASTFSDWWGYKYEVIEASAYNAALLNESGVITCINSDDAEMGRRLNQEAAKTIKYGGVSEEDAWKMVTLNPAKLMGIDNKVGSIKAGKDADLVLWDGNPLSLYSKPITTYIEGVAYFDAQLHAEEETMLMRRKQNLIEEMNNAVAKGKKGETPQKKEETLYHCDDEEVYGEEGKQ